jgi:hypothetical protein
MGLGYNANTQPGAGIMKTTTESFEELFNKVQRLNRTLAVINKAYSVLIHSRTEGELYSGVCEAVTSQNEFSLAWVGVPLDDDKKSVKVFASAGKASAYLNGIEVSWGDNPLGNGPTGRSIRTGKIQFNNNRLASRQFSPWRAKAKEFKLQSTFSLPVKFSTGQVVSALMVYSEQAHSFFQDELGLLDQFCADLGYCVEFLRTKAANEKSS